jgi:hypothetical protein
LYVREPENLTEEKMEELQHHVQDKIPGYDFESHHMQVMHHPELCIAGDIFTHPKAKPYTEIHKIKRKFVTKESDMHIAEDEHMKEA